MAELADALTELARTETLLVALDFDGTLAPLVDDPSAARAHPEAREAMLALVDAPRTTVALISGRAMESLLDVSEAPDGVLLSGSHGIEVRLGSEPEVTLTSDELDRVTRLGEALNPVANRYDGAWLEAKPAGFALHTRLAADSDALAAQEEAGLAASSIGDLTIRPGNNVLEFSVRSTNKGDAISRLRRHAGATAVLFAGDDVTDEDGFTALKPGDVGIKCGSGPTAAEFSVPGIPQVASALAQLARLRREG
jgi:trehalose 6-phosphate phosphatase